MFKNIEDFDYILSLGAFFEDSEVKNEVINSCKRGAKFIYMHPIDNFELKSFYTQFIKYEVAGEEAILALILNFFTKEEALSTFLNNLDIGYLSAESSAGEEEFEEAFSSFEESKKRVLLIGDDLIAHPRVDNIIKLLANIKRYTNFELIFLNSGLKEKVNSCEDFTLDEIEDLRSFNGTLIYFLAKENSDILLASQTFANIAKVTNNQSVTIKIENKILEKVVKIDSNLLGTIALVEGENSSYRFSKVVVEKKEQN